jgi:gas vesicle protein
MAVENLQEIKLQIGLLDKDIKTQHTVLDKISDSIEKIQELNINLIKMMSLHEQRLEQHEKTDKFLAEQIELRRRELIDDIKDLHSRITTTSRELTDKMSELEGRVLDKLSDIKNEIHTNPSKPELTLKDQIENKYFWIFIGGAAVILWIIDHINLGVLGTLIQK